MFRNNFYPRTLQESATHEFGHVVDATTISIHTPYKRVRQIVDTSNVDNYVFQSTHPTRECDPQLGGTTTTTLYFNPRTLQESATKGGVNSAILDMIFQSTHPTRECDSEKLKLHVNDDISIHAPYKRVRLATCLATSLSLSYFNPRTLQESATDQFGIAWHISIFQSTHPTRECDDDEYVGFYKSKEWHFNPRTLQESAT